MMNYLLKWTVIGSLLMFLAGCASATTVAATPSTTSTMVSTRTQAATIQPTPTETLVPKIKLFLCFTNSEGILGTGCRVSEPFAVVFVPLAPGQSLEYSWPLPGDIRGSEYQAGLAAASEGSNQMRISLLYGRVDEKTEFAAAVKRIDRTTMQGGAEWLLTGEDPETRKGDLLILRIENVQDADPKMNAACRFNFGNT
jgi:hypothetical protein